MLLLFSLVPAMLLVQTFSQSFTTVTTQMTTVNYVSRTDTQTIQVSSYVTTATIKTTIAEAWTQSAIDTRHCLVEYYPINLDAGQPLSGTITADQKESIVVYFMTEQQVNAWRQASQRYCDPAENQISVLWYAGTGSNRVTQASMRYTATVAGVYYLVIETYYYRPVGLTINLVTEYGQTTTVVLRQTVLSTAIYSLTQTITSEIVQQLSTQPTSNLGSSDMLLPIILVIAVLGVLVVGVVVRSSRRRARTPTPAMAQGVRSERFCISCGAKLSPDAKFCKKCGSAQN